MTRVMARRQLARFDGLVELLEEAEASIGNSSQSSEAQMSDPSSSAVEYLDFHLIEWCVTKTAWSTLRHRLKNGAPPRCAGTATRGIETGIGVLAAHRRHPGAEG